MISGDRRRGFDWWVLLEMWVCIHACDSYDGLGTRQFVVQGICHFSDYLRLISK